MSIVVETVVDVGVEMSVETVVDVASVEAVGSLSDLRNPVLPGPAERHERC